MNIRSSDVFLKEDIAAILRALALTIDAAAPPDDDYAIGYCTALAAVAVALNIAPGDTVPDGVRQWRGLRED